MDRFYSFLWNTVVLKPRDDMRMSLGILKAFDIVKCEDFDDKD
jgi:hypothetical protein